MQFSIAVVALVVAVGLSLGCDESPSAAAAPVAPTPMQEVEVSIHPLSHTVKSIDGEDVDLSRYRGKVVLFVNVASRCGHTKQYADLQKMHEQYAQQGLAVLGFPCNQFGGQEPGAEAEIKTFCQSKYNVTFDLFAKVDVNGEQAAPLFREMTNPAAPVADPGPVKWNFEKFLVDRNGRLIGRYRSGVKPADEVLVKALEAALAQPAATAMAQGG